MLPAPRSVALFLICFASVATADDFKTIEGKEYKNATVNRVEPDGIVLTTKTGISKVYFVELPYEIQQRFHYDAAQAAQFTTAAQNTISQSNAAVAAEQEAIATEQHRKAEIAQQEQAAEQQRQAQIDRQQEAQQIRAARAAAANPHAKAKRPAASSSRQSQVQQYNATIIAQQRQREQERVQREGREQQEQTQRNSEQWRRENERQWQQVQERQETFIQQSRVQSAQYQLQLDQNANGWHNKEARLQMDRENLRYEQEQQKRLQEKRMP